MDGKLADSDSNGYIVNGFSSLTIPGWRLDNSKVAQFFFEDQKGQGYAAQTDQGGNEGVIGLMVFQEKALWTNTYLINEYKDWYDNNKKKPWDPWSEKSIIWNTNDTTGVIYTSNTTAGPVYGSGRGSSTGGSSNIQCNVAATPTMDAAAVSEAEDNPLSTGFGKEEGHRVREVYFNKGDHLTTLVIYYDSRKGLEKRGIQVAQPAPRTPNPFPGGVGCTPPANWKG